MIRFVLLCLACVLTAAGTAGCAPDTLPPPEGSAASATPTTGGPLDGTPEPDDELSGAPSDQKATRYGCDNGDQVTARYPDTEHAKIVYQNKTRPMHIAVSADGARYVGPNYEWWTRGSGENAEAILFAHREDGSTGDKVATCHPAG